MFTPKDELWLELGNCEDHLEPRCAARKISTPKRLPHMTVTFAASNGAAAPPEGPSA